MHKYLNELLKPLWFKEQHYVALSKKFPHLTPHFPSLPFLSNHNKIKPEIHSLGHAEQFSTAETPTLKYWSVLSK